MPIPSASPTAASTAPDPRLEQFVRAVMLLSLALVMLLPSARAYSPLLGWVPLWLLGMPAVAWWSLYRFRLPASPGSQAPPATGRRPGRRRASAQARRREATILPRRLPHAA